MSVTITRFHVSNGTGIVKAFASVELGGVVVIHGVRLMESRDGGLFVGMPAKKSEKDNKWYDHVTVVNSDLKEEIRRELVTRYEQGTVKAVDGRREDTSDETMYG